MSDYSENDDEPQLYGDARNYFGHSPGLLSDLWGIFTLAASALLIAGAIFLAICYALQHWYLFVNEFFFGATIPIGGAVEGDMTIFAFVTTVIALFGITAAICFTVYRIKKLEIDAEYRHKSLEQDHAFQMKYLEAQQSPTTSPPTSEN